MKKEIDNIFVDVRNAFRLLSRFQERVLNIVNYIREQTPYIEMWGSKGWYSKEIGNKKSPCSNYAKLNVCKDMSGLDFLYGHFFEYYFGTYPQKGKPTIEMSIFQVSDDGYFVSNEENKDMTDVSSYASSEGSHSYIIFNVSVYTTKKSELWLYDPERPEDNPKDFLTRFLESSKDTKITCTDKEHTILKKYEMQRFTSQSEADKVITDFAKLVKDNTGVEFFKENFYRSDSI